MATLYEWAEENESSLMAEWSEKNAPLTPKDITYGSNRLCWWKGSCGHEWQATVKTRTAGSRCPYCTGKKVLAGFNDLKSQSPMLAEQWSEKNAPLLPEDFSFKSSKKVWWVGTCGHEWMASIKNRMNGAGCPYCAGNKILEGVNDLKTLDPDLAKEWSGKNRIKPTQVTVMSNKRILWKCRTCRHEWTAKIADRSRGSKCPVCSGAVIKAGVNDLATTHPDLAAEWSVRNKNLDMKTLSCCSRKSVWWTCSICGHEWRAAIDYRCKGHGCPACNKARRYNQMMENRLQEEKQKELRRDIIEILLQYFAEEEGINILFDDTTAIGLRLSFYFPDQKGALELSGRTSLENRRREYVKNHLCSKSGIRMIRLLYNGEKPYDDCMCIELETDEVEEQMEALKTVFEMLKIPIEGN